MIEIKSLDEYLHQIEEALIEVDELQASIEYDGDYMQPSAHLIQPLRNTLETLRDEVKAGTHTFGNGSLDYMETIDQLPNAIIPFKYLLKVINDVHVNGVVE